MKIARILLIALTFFAIDLAVAQTMVKGTVKDSLGAPIIQANIYLQAGNDLAIIAFGYTNAEGTYSILTEASGDLILNASSLSFETLKIKFRIDAADPPKEIIRNITMKTQPFELTEAVVNADIPILVKKDTIIINTKDFTDGTEEVVEDILKKLPGIEVAKDGTIKVQGRAVEKVMVENDDLFVKGYKLLTKNLHAGVIDKVEILQHFSDNALLKNIEDSDKVALNITLKDDQKASLFGKASLGYGTKQFYENKLNLISFNKKTKYYVFGNLNNTGSDAIGDIYQLIYPDAFTSSTYIGDGVSSQNLMVVAANRPNLNENKYNFNNAKLASLNGIYNPTKALKLKGLFFLTSDENNFNNRHLEVFNVPPINFTNTERYRLQKNAFAVSGKWDALYDFDKNSRIKYIGRYTNGSFRDKAEIRFNEDSLNENLTNKTSYTDHRITYTKKINSYKAIQVTGRYINDRKDQNYRVDEFLLQDLFPERDSIASVSQENKIGLRFIGMEGSYLYNRKRNNFSMRTGFAHEKNTLVSTLFFMDSLNNRMEVGGDYKNTFMYSVNDLYVKANYKWQFNSIAIRSGVEFHQFYVKSGDQGSFNKNAPITLVPNFGVSWQINKKNKLFGSYKYSTKNIPIDQLYTNYVLTNYRNFKRGVGTFRQLKGSFYLASYILGNWSDSFLINTSIIYNKDHDYITNNSFIRPNFTQSTSISLKDRDFYSMNFTGDRFIEILSFNLKLKAGMSKNMIQNIINASNLREINTKTYTYGGEIRSVFNGFFNYHFGTNWTSSKIVTSQERQIINNDSFLDLDFKISEAFKFKLINEFYHFGDLVSNNTFYFTDLESSYTIKKNKFELKLIVNNIFNSATFSNVYLNDTGSYSSSYDLIPRYVLLKVDYRF